MRVGFLGMTHLGQTLADASRIRGHEVEIDHLWSCDLVLVTQDVEDHGDLGNLDALMEWAACVPRVPLVLVSQVPPGYTRRWAKRGNLFYQVDTIIMSCALRRAVFPERFVVGCADKRLGLPLAYLQYLQSFDAPIMLMSYESAELVKLAVNYYLAKQIEATNELAQVAKLVGAEWDEMVPGIAADKRIGAYLRPGEVGGHLPRDVRTIERLLLEKSPCLSLPSSELLPS